MMSGSEPENLKACLHDCPHQEAWRRVTTSLLDHIAKVAELQTGLANAHEQEQQLQNRLQRSRDTRVQLQPQEAQVRPQPTQVDSATLARYKQKINNQRDTLAQLNRTVGGARQQFAQKVHQQQDQLANLQRTLTEVRKQYEQKLVEQRAQLAKFDRLVKDLQQQLGTGRTDSTLKSSNPQSQQVFGLSLENQDLHQQLVAQRQEIERLAGQTEIDYKRAQRYKNYSKELEKTVRAYEEAYNAGRDAGKCIVELLKQECTGTEDPQARIIAIQGLAEELDRIIGSAPPSPRKIEARGSSEAPPLSIAVALKEKPDAMRNLIEDSGNTESTTTTDLSDHPDRLRRVRERRGSSDEEGVSLDPPRGPQRSDSNCIPVSSKRRLEASSDSTVNGESAAKVAKVDPAKAGLHIPSCAMIEAAKFEAAMMAEAGADQGETSQ